MKFYVIFNVCIYVKAGRLKVKIPNAKQIMGKEIGA